MRAYFKFTASSVISTVLDYFITIFLTEVLSVLYIISSAIGLVSGGAVNFLINKNWVFEHKDRRDYRLAVLYAAVWTTNLLMNTLGLYLLTEHLRIDYRISKIIASISVGALLSYFAQKKIVFRDRPSEQVIER